LASNRP